MAPEQSLVVQQEASVAVVEEEEVDEPQPIVPGQPTATGEIPEPAPPPKPVRRRPSRKQTGDGAAPKKRSSSPRVSRKKPSSAS